jgi:hypothetical protein
MQRQVGLAAPVDPSAGVPYHVLIVGSPEKIPFEFQALLDLQWSVGRLHFDHVEDYGRYAKAVVDYEAAEFRPAQSKSVSAWITRNRSDVATAMLSGAVVENFTNTNRSLGARQGFKLGIFAGDQATKEQLEKVLRGQTPNGPPAVLFTGSHGAEWPLTDPDLQKRFEGALVTQEWSEGQPLGANNQFSGEDLPDEAKLHGMIAFTFACFGGGCPSEDNYYLNEDGSRIEIAPRPFISSLAQAMLARGTLAVIAHIDRAFTYIFQDAFQTPQVQSLRTPIDRLLNGDRVGLAADSLNLQWSVLAAQLAAKQELGSARAKDPGLCDTLRFARDDARNYVVLGDPAVRLRIDRLQ